MSKDLFTALFFVVLVIILALMPLIGNLVPEERAINALEDAGFSNIVIQSRSPYFARYKGCGEDDWVIFKAKAVNPLGKKVDVIVCSGLLKGATIRYKR